MALATRSGLWCRARVTGEEPLLCMHPLYPCALKRAQRVQEDKEEGEEGMDAEAAERRRMREAEEWRLKQLRSGVSSQANSNFQVRRPGCSPVSMLRSHPLDAPVMPSRPAPGSAPPACQTAYLIMICLPCLAVMLITQRPSALQGCCHTHILLARRELGLNVQAA